MDAESKVCDFSLSQKLDFFFLIPAGMGYAIYQEKF